MCLEVARSMGGRVSANGVRGGLWGNLRAGTPSGGGRCLAVPESVKRASGWSNRTPPCYCQYREAVKCPLGDAGMLAYPDRTILTDLQSRVRTTPSRSGAPPTYTVAKLKTY